MTVQKIIPIKIGKNTKHEYAGQIYDSKEETYFQWFCDDLEKSGDIKLTQYQPEQMEIIPAPEYFWAKKNIKSETEKPGNLLQSLDYTPDFVITWNKKGVEKYVYTLNGEDISVHSRTRKPFVAIRNKNYPNDDLISYIDVKGTFGRHGDAVKFPVLQKVIFFTKGIYVEKIIPKKLFKKTFYPERYLFTDGLGRERKL